MWINYLTTLEILKKNKLMFQFSIFVKENIELDEMKINKLFEKHVFKLPRW
jgi:hypothetical protein